MRSRDSSCLHVGDMGHRDTEMADIVPSWMWQSPGDIIERLVGVSSRSARRGEAISLRVVVHTPRDRYYTQAKRLHVKQLMKSKR